MYRILTLGLGVLVASLPGVALAADGDACTTAAADWNTTQKGRMKPIWCAVVCDNDSTNGDCAEFDLEDMVGVPDVISFQLHEVDVDDSGGAGDCTAGTVTINTSHEQGLTTASENAHDLDASVTAVSIGGTTKINLDTRRAPTDRYILATTSAMACTNDAIDLIVIGYEEQK